ncbi:MAG: glycosyltransferase family 4 protein [Clostridiaceae bacterium]|nr:glycosyltransferase family 4 protein [Clostridiaceae bacterium]
MKRLVILYPIYFEQVHGGAELQISYIAKAAKVAGFEVFYIYINNDTPIENIDQLSLYPLSRKLSLFAKNKGWFLYYFQIMRILKKVTPDIIYTRHTSSWNGYAAQYARKNNARHIHALASDRAPLQTLRLINFIRFFEIFEILFMNYGLKHAYEIIAQNRAQQNSLQTRFRRQGVLINQMTPYQRSGIIKKQDPIQVLWIGNLKRIKRPELFIELSQKIGELAIEYKMIMVGRIATRYIPLLNNAKENLQNFEFRGELTQLEVYKLLEESHILVNTSEFEGFSNTFVQAWMRKVPVISMSSNPSNILTDYKLGFVTPSMTELVKSVKELILDTELREIMGLNAYNYAVENHGLESNLSKIISLFCNQ